MKLVSKVFRPGGSTHEFAGKQYHFREENPAEGSKHDNEAIPHVCDVKEKAAQQRFLETGGFTIFGDDEAPAVVTKPPSNTTKNTDPAAGKADEAKVAEIKALSIAALKENIATYSDVDLAAALEAEKADTDPRKGFIEAIEAHVAQ